ncbi:MAG TPA: phage portal protein, partial [Clostridiales bacterium]|nr:phage portal protein [Clostridiales bacterium]
RSSFQKHKYKLVRTGANLGDTYLIVQELDEFPFARIIVANSEDMEIFTNPHDQEETERAHQHYNFYDEQAQKVRSWDRVWFKDRIETYIDGKFVEEYSGEYKYFTEVPVIQIKHIDIGEAYGLHTWHSIQAQMDAVNEIASYLWLILQRYGEPTLIATGPKKPEKIVRRDGNVIYVGLDGDLRILEYTGNVLPQIIEFSRIVTDYIQNSLPELSLNKIRDLGNLSGYAVSMHLADMIAKIEELRGNYADGIEYANALALKARLKSRAPIEEFQNDIIYQPILPEDEISKWAVNRQRLDLGIESRQSIMREEGYTEEEIAERFEELRQELEQTLEVTYPNRIDEEFMRMGFGNE